MADAVAIEVYVNERVAAEIDLLKQELDVAYPTWQEETYNRYTNEQGIVTDDVCLPIRAAIELIKQMRGWERGAIDTSKAVDRKRTSNNCEHRYVVLWSCE